MKLFLSLLLVIVPFISAKSFYILNNSSLTITVYVSTAVDCSGSGGTTYGPYTLAPSEDFYDASISGVFGVQVVGYPAIYGPCTGCGVGGSYPFTWFWDGPGFCSTERIVFED